MSRIIKIGTRESQLAVWQASLVKKMLADNGIASELVCIKSEGDIDLQTPLYKIGVQGIFTRSLDIALLNNRIDIAVHSMKDVPTDLANGIVKAAVLKRASYKDILVPRGGVNFLNDASSAAIIATSSIRRKAQWLNKYPNHEIADLRGNVNTRLQKVKDSNWNGAVFAAAGLERIDLRPSNAVELDWMLPAPAQGAIMVVCRSEDEYALKICTPLNDSVTETCVNAERDFLKKLMGGCTTPISALAKIENGSISFDGSLLTADGKQKETVHIKQPVEDGSDIGKKAAEIILASQMGKSILNSFRNGQ